MAGLVNFLAAWCYI